MTFGRWRTYCGEEGMLRGDQTVGWGYLYSSIYRMMMYGSLSPRLEHDNEQRPPKRRCDGDSVPSQCSDKEASLSTEFNVLLSGGLELCAQFAV